MVNEVLSAVARWNPYPAAEGLKCLFKDGDLPWRLEEGEGHPFA